MIMMSNIEIRSISEIAKELNETEQSLRNLFRKGTKPPLPVVFNNRLGLSRLANKGRNQSAEGACGWAW